MEEQTKRSVLKENLKFFITHLIVMAVLSLICILILNAVSWALTDTFFIITMGLLFAFVAFMIYYFIYIVLKASTLTDFDYGIYTVLSYVFIIATAVFIFLFCYISNANEDDQIGLKAGDYSQYSCEICQSPANGGRYYISKDRPTEYYCYTHYMEEKKLYDEISKEKEEEKRKEEEEKYKVKCKLCNKSFDRDSLNGENIKQDDYCIDCEVALRQFDDAWGD